MRGNGTGTGIRRIETAERPRMSRRFDLPKGCSVSSFTVRELENRDREVAAMNAEKRLGKNASPAKAFMVEAFEKLRLSLVDVDGLPVNGEPLNPYRGVDRWSERTMRFLERAFTVLNGVTEEEMEDFGEGVVVESRTTAPASEALSEESDAS